MRPPLDILIFVVGCARFPWQPILLTAESEMKCECVYSILFRPDWKQKKEAYSSAINNNSHTNIFKLSWAEFRCFRFTTANRNEQTPLIDCDNGESCSLHLQFNILVIWRLVHVFICLFHVMIGWGEILFLGRLVRRPGGAQSPLSVALLH